jgi:hypothetical protein
LASLQESNSSDRPSNFATGLGQSPQFNLIVDNSYASNNAFIAGRFEGSDGANTGLISSQVTNETGAYEYGVSDLQNGDFLSSGTTNWSSSEDIFQYSLLTSTSSQPVVGQFPEYDLGFQGQTTISPSLLSNNFGMGDSQSYVPDVGNLSATGFSDSGFSMITPHSFTDPQMHESVNNNNIPGKEFDDVSNMATLAPVIPTHDPTPSSMLAPINTDPRFLCTYTPCTKSFKRDYERIRHENSMHINTQGAHLCPITGAQRVTGRGIAAPIK